MTAPDHFKNHGVHYVKVKIYYVWILKVDTFYDFRFAKLKEYRKYQSITFHS